MQLEDLGYTKNWESFRIQEKLENFEIGRIIAEHKERYIVKTDKTEYEAEITGNMRFTADSREDFPAVGDWVALTPYDADFAIINKLFPRFSVIKRKAVGHFGEFQIIATNIDYAFLIQAVDRDFNINRLERYLTICYSSKVEPIIILTKTDLIEPQILQRITENINHRIKNVRVLAISNITQDGYESLKNIIEKGKTYCLLGSSGVGKSTLLNNLTGKSVMRTDTISEYTNKGRHITTHRELVVLENGGILIDNPGMREVGITDAYEGVETVFDTITLLSHNCKYKDCTHTQESGCAVLEALNNNEIDTHSYNNYLKIEKERAYLETTILEKRKKEKLFGKILKDYNKRNVKGKRN